MLTARGEDMDRIIGLEMGADDYLAKPFVPRREAHSRDPRAAAPHARTAAQPRRGTAGQRAHAALCELAARHGQSPPGGCRRQRGRAVGRRVPHARRVPFASAEGAVARPVDGADPGPRGRRLRSLDRPAGEPPAPAPRRQRARVGDHQDRAQRGLCARGRGDGGSQRRTRRPRRPRWRPDPGAAREAARPDERS